MEKIYINFLNSSKNFTIDKKVFSGENKFDNAVKWGKENISNFNLDMINYEN